jgi:hypothetical protein
MWRNSWAAASARWFEQSRPLRNGVYLDASSSPLEPPSSVFSPNFKFSYDFTPKIAAGFEYCGSVGQVTGFDAVAQQQHQIFPSIDLNIAPQWEINFGLGVGLTGATDHLLAKMILGYRFSF